MLQYHCDSASLNVSMSANAAIEIPNIRTNLSESFGNVKKQMMQFNWSALCFIGLKVDPFKTRLKEFLLSVIFSAQPFLVLSEAILLCIFRILCRHSESTNHTMPAGKKYKPSL